MPLQVGKITLHMGPQGAGAPDDLETAIVDFIDGAKRRLDIAVQELDNVRIAEAIIRAKKRRVRVRLVLEGDYLTVKRPATDPWKPGGQNEQNRTIHDAILCSAIFVRSDFNAVVTDLISFPEPGPKIIVLATDGEPDTCAVPDPQTGQPEAIAAAMNANANGIDVFVISVGEGVVSLGHLQDMANAGLGLPVGGATNAPFWEATDQTDLINAFQSIVSGVLSCTLDLNGNVNTMTAGMGNVTLDGMSLGFMDPDGWEVVDTDTIRLVGAACTTLQDGGNHTVTATFPCDVIL